MGIQIHVPTSTSLANELLPNLFEKSQVIRIIVVSEVDNATSQLASVERST
jgi:hypothetical protein